jgi:tetratricopeptide (TPR) repeat protein
VYRNLKEYLKAKEYYTKSIELMKQQYGENNNFLAISYHNLALLYQDNKDYENAQTYFKKSLLIVLDVLPNNHPEIATIYHNLGYLYNEWAKPSQSFKNYFEALKIRLSLELSPVNIKGTKISFNNIKEVISKLSKLHKEEKESINKQISELNTLFAKHKEFKKMKLKKVQ